MNLRRKRMILMDGQWYGYLRTASGNPLTLQSAKRLRQLTIYGNAVQDGTPSPDAPVEVQLCGDRTGNLFDENKINKQNPTNQDIELNLDNNETYCLFSNINGGKGLIIIYAKTTGTDELKEIARNDTTQRFKNFVVDYTQYSGYILRWFAYSGENSINNIAIYKGSYTADTLPAYEPYGYKVSGRVEGLNLFDAEGIASNTEDSDTKIEQFQNKKSLKWVSNGSTYKQYFMQGEFEENTQYTFSFNLYANGAAEILLFYTDGTHSRVVTACSGNWVRKIVTTSANKTLDYWRGNYTDGTIVYVDIGSSMIVKGKYTSATMPPYEPYQPPQEFAVYLPEQIAKVGDVADEVVVDMEKQTAELKKNILKYEHSNDWRLGSNGKNDVTQRFYQMSSRHLALNSRVISNVFAELNPSSITIINNDTEGFNCSNNSYLQVRVNKSRLDTVDASGFKSWLAAYEETTPLIIYGEALTPVTTDITSLQDWDAIPQVSGTVTLTLSAEVEPSGAEAVYYSKERGE